jgi:hypothetical protein
MVEEIQKKCSKIASIGEIYLRIVVPQLLTRAQVLTFDLFRSKGATN